MCDPFESLSSRIRQAIEEEVRSGRKPLLVQFVTQATDGEVRPGLLVPIPTACLGAPGALGAPEANGGATPGEAPTETQEAVLKVLASASDALKIQAIVNRSKGALTMSSYLRTAVRGLVRSGLILARPGNTYWLASRPLPD